jgi:hypothetical protein
MTGHAPAMTSATASMTVESCARARSASSVRRRVLPLPRTRYAAAQKSRPAADDNGHTAPDHWATMVLMLATVTTALAAAIMCGTVGVVVLIARLLNAIDLADTDSEGEDGGDTGGGGGSGRPRKPEPPAGGNDPAWWPDFEAELADYIASSPRPVPDEGGDEAGRISGRARVARPAPA